MYCRLFFKYLAIENIVRNAVENLGLEAKPKIEGLSNLFILLSIREKAWNVGAIKNTMKT